MIGKKTLKESERKMGSDSITGRLLSAVKVE